MATNSRPPPERSAAPVWLPTTIATSLAERRQARIVLQRQRVAERRRVRIARAQERWPKEVFAVMLIAEIRGGMSALIGSSMSSPHMDQQVNDLFPLTLALAAVAAFLCIVSGWRCLTAWAWLKFLFQMILLAAGALVAGWVAVRVLQYIVAEVASTDASLGYSNLNHDLMWLAALLFIIGLVVTNVSVIRDICESTEYRDYEEFDPAAYPDTPPQRSINNLID